MDRLDRAVLQRGDDVLVRGTIALATIAWAAAECLRLQPSPGRDRIARLLWTAGAVLAGAHALAAFHVVHAWSHRAALIDTARQTAALTGIHWGGGLWVNYAFLLIWIVDAGWWWAAPAGYQRRHPALRHTMLAFFVFMFVNGAIVFAHGAMRMLGAAAVTAVGLTWYRAGRG